MIRSFTWIRDIRLLWRHGTSMVIRNLSFRSRGMHAAENLLLLLLLLMMLMLLLHLLLHLVLLMVRVHWVDCIGTLTVHVNHISGVVSMRIYSSVLDLSHRWID